MSYIAVYLKDNCCYGIRRNALADTIVCEDGLETAKSMSEHKKGLR